LQPDVNIERFLTLALFFVVSIFYVFFWERLIQDGKRSTAIVEENRLAELMVEITRALSSSLNADQVLYSIVHRLRDALEAEECCIYRIDSRTGDAQMMMKASNPAERNISVDLERHPELKQASISRELRIVPDGKSAGLIAIPMLVNDSLLGLIEVRSARWRPIMAGSNVRFFEVISGAASNALRNAELFAEVERRAHTDFLTDLPNRQYFQTTLSVEMARAQRHNREVSLLMIDLDFLKAVNDRYGHPNGDIVIRGVAETIRWSCRESDFAARYGGEEFTVILPETPLSGAVQVAERIRERIAAAQFPGIGRITASIGVSNYPGNARTKDDLIHAADRALYVAKNAGRDRVAHIAET
jgi:diguanylate cyclase (GGDEF)-like protein